MPEAPERLEPWWLPGLPAGRSADGSDGWWEGRTPSGLAFRVPRLGRMASERVASTVRAAALEARRERSLAQVLSTASRVARRLALPEDPLGERAVSLLRDELGWTAELASETLSGMAEIWTEEALGGLLASELGDPGVLEGFRPDPMAGAPPRRRRAAGPPLLFQVFAANVPGVAVTAILRGLLARSGLLCRVASGEPGLPALFARALAEADPLLGRSLAVSWWPAECAEESWAAWVKRSGKVVVYGGDEAVSGVRSKLPPDRELVAYGPRIGVGVVLPDAVEEGAAETAARGLARDACAYEQQGCVSPRLVYVIGDPAAFASRLAAALEAEARRIPRPRPERDEAIAIRAARAEAEFGGYAEDRTERIFGSPDLAWTVLVARGTEPVAAPLRRLVRLCGLRTSAELEEVLRPLEGRIQVLAYAGSEGLEELAALAVRLAASRLAPFGTAAWPPSDWRHDGRHQLLPLLRWTDWEGERADDGERADEGETA